MLSDLLLFFCLTKFMREFIGNNYTNNYKGAEEGTENVYFNYYIEIIKQVLDLGVEQAIKGIAKTSLSF